MKLEKVLNKIGCFFGIHLWTIWQGKSRIEKNKNAVIWFERECVYCKQKEIKNFGD